MRLLRRSLFGSLLAFLVFLGREPTADACGGCFHEEAPPTPAQRSVVTDHRMAFALSPERTILWDQIRYAGDPREFAWVLPVRPGTTVELSRDQWFAALDASTQPVIQGPSYYGTGYGCALGGCGSQGGEGASSAPGPGQVELVSQSVIGPYETVTLRATDSHALENWLHQHAFAIPDTIQPTIDAYVSEGFDFIALRLRPDCGQKAMQPVRVVSPGADASLPLRMVAAGVGANVGITLYVISEGRYEPQNFPVVAIDYGKLVWDRVQNRSNYEELSQAAMAQNDGRSWILESAGLAQLGPGQSPNSSNANPGLFDAYTGTCGGIGAGGGGGGAPSPCPNAADAGDLADAASDVGPDASSDAPADAGELDAEVDASGDAEPIDGATDAPPDAALEPPDANYPYPPYDANYSPYPPYPPPNAACEGFDDLDVATFGMHAGTIWVTRLRALLPAEALSAGDLRLTASAEQIAVSSYHQAYSYSDDAQPKDTRKACAGAPVRHRPFSPVALGVVGLLAAAAALRRRR